MADLNPLEYFICGGFGGICNVLVGHPLDTVKVRLQTTTKYKGTMDCISQTIKSEGVFGLYKGMTAPLVGIAPIFAISFFGYGIGKMLFHAEQEDYQKLRTFGAGAFSGICTTSIISPFERVKCLLQIQAGGGGEKKYNGPADVVKQLYKEGGIASIYRGVVSTALRDVPAAGLYFLTYSYLSQLLSNPGEPPSFPATIFAGGMSGITNWIIGMPADTLKSRLQTAPEGTYPGGLKQVFSELMKKEGVGALYKGFTPVILRAFPANAACFLGFEIAANCLRKFH